jgi:hypothetical protein
MTTPQTLAGIAPSRTRTFSGPFLPSLSDLLFIALIVWLFLAGPFGWKGLLSDGDVGWHIRTGEYILDHHSVPRADLYSFSKPGAPWYAWEWLSDVIDASLYRAAGLKGVVLLAGLLIALFGTLLIRRMIWRDSHLFIAVIVGLLAIGASSIHFLARPHVFTLVLLSISVWMIESDMRKQTKWIWLLIPMTVVWTNLHGGFLVVIALLGLTVVGGLFNGTWLRYGLLTAACAAASIVNPYGIQLHIHVGEYLKSDWIRSFIQEFQSPTFRGESMMQFEALLLGGIVIAGFLLKQKRFAEALWILFFAHEALSSQRHVPIFALVASPLIAEQLSTFWRDWTANLKKSSPLAIINQMSADFVDGFRRTSVWPALGAIALMFIGRPIAWPKDFPDEMFPTALIHAHESEIFNSRLLTTDQWADYLIFLNPSQKVFVDGRSDFFGPEIGNQFLHVTNGQADWKDIMQKWQFSLVLLPKESALVQLLQTQPEWRVEAQDDKHILLARKATSVPATGILNTEPRF